MKHNSTLNIYLSLIVLSVLFFIPSNIFSQDYNIREFENQTANKQTTLKQNKTNNRDAFYDLTFKMHPTYYFQNNELKNKYGKGVPLKLTFRDLKSVENLYDNTLNYSQVQLITIDLLNINDLNNIIDLTINNQPFQNLKYIFLRCNFNCNEQQINKFIKVNSDIRVFFTTEKGS
jgi:hypothetical protein